MSTKLESIFCPTCEKPGTWVPDNPARPFCSERCKLIDLGEWADGSHSLPGDPIPPDDIDDQQ